MERPPSPWKPSDKALELEIQQKSLKDMRERIRAFAKENGITYDIAGNSDELDISADERDFESLSDYAKEIMDDLNKSLIEQAKGFVLVIERRANSFRMSVLPRSGTSNTKDESAQKKPSPWSIQ